MPSLIWWMTILTLKRFGLPNLLQVQYMLTEAVRASPKPLRVMYRPLVSNLKLKLPLSLQLLRVDGIVVWMVYIYAVPNGQRQILCSAFCVEKK